MKVRGEIGERNMTYEVNDNKDIKKVHDETLAIHRLAAKSQIKQLQLDQDGK